MEGVENTEKQSKKVQPPKKYVILRTLGKGSFGKVKEAIHVASGEKIAIKILEKGRIRNHKDE